MGPPLFSMSLHLAAFIAILSASLIPDIEGARNSAGSQQQQTPADFDCPEEFGYYAHPTDCTLYYVCVFGGALLESCTGGLMYSHELQTCDWPRNVGCAPGQQQQISQPQQQHITQKISQQPVSQQVDTTSTSRGRQRQQQIQIPKADLYTEEEDLGPAEEIESDRQQRVYRGQPSTLGQVASDRDGLNTHSNAIPVQSTGGRDKLSVVSYGAQQQYNRASVQPVQQQVYDTRGYNTTRYIQQQQQQYDPNYYTVYDEEAEQYKDIADYSQYIQQNKQDIYARKKPSVEIVQQEPIQRGSPYTKNKYSNQQENIYQSVTPQEYDSYSIQTNDDIPYRQVQTKSNNRYPEVKESGSTQGERRLITLSAKYSDGNKQTDTKTDTDFGSPRSDTVVTETNVVNITPRNSDRTSGSAEQASARNHNPSFAQQINALAQGGNGEDPIAKVLEALSKSEEYLSDEASTERSSESRGRGESGEVNGKSITVEELDIDFLKKLNSQSRSREESGNGFRNSPVLTSNQKQPSINLNDYGIGIIQVQSTPTPNLRQGLTPSQQSRQAKVVQEITTPKPLIVRLPEAFNPRTNTFETSPLLSRNRPDSRESDSIKHYTGRQDLSRSRGSAKHRESNEFEDAQNRRGNLQDRSSEQRRNNINSGHTETQLNEFRGHYDLRQGSVNSETQRGSFLVTPRTTFTAAPIRITVEPIKNQDNLREIILKEYNQRIEENRNNQPESVVPSRGLSNSKEPTINLQASGIRSIASSQEEGIPQKKMESIENPNKHLVIRIPENIQTTQIRPREKLKPLSDYVNANVNTMIEDVNRRKVGDSLESSRSVEEQTSEEARKPVAIRVPENYSRKNSEERTSQTKYDKSNEDYSRKPIRYVDSLEYKEDDRTGYRRGSSRYMPSIADEYDEEELINVTDEPKKPISVRFPERPQSRGQSSSRETGYRNSPVPLSHDSVSHGPTQEERRRIVYSQAPKQVNTENTESVRPVAIKVPDSVDLNQYRNKEQSPVARVVESLTSSRERSRTEDESRHPNEQVQRMRISTSSKESGREELRNRYEVATTLRPSRVLSVPTTSKPTRPPKKFRNGTLYSDLTLPIGTDITDTNLPEPDPTIRARPMSFNVPTTPGLTRGNLRHRGSLTYTVSPNEAEPPALPRGTPPPQRGRPTLKPSTTVVGKAAEFVDIYRYPARRPDNVYPTPQVDKTAAKCRKDVCLLPDCYCGGKDIPGDLSPEETPQIVLLTFDDSVNDLNKGLYSDLFDKGRVNPNGCPIGATFYVSHEWTDYSQVQNLYAGGHEIASHSVSHSFGEQFSQKKWTREIAGQREILAAYGGVKLEDIRGMRAPFLAVGGNKMFKMLYDSNFTYDSSMPVYENRPPSWPYTLDYKVFHDCMIPPCPTKSYPGVWEVPMVMWQDLNGGRCSMGDACSNPPTSDGVYKMLIKNFERHFTTNRAPFGLFYHAAWFTQPHHKEGFIAFLDTINKMPEVWLITNWQAVQWVRDPTPLSRLGNFQPFQCNYPDRPKKCNNPKVCNLWHKSGVRYMRTCQACPDIYPWTGKSGVRNSRVDNDLE